MIRMIPLSMTFGDIWPRYQGHDIFRHWIYQKRHKSHSYYRTSKSYALSHGDICNDLDGPLTRFSRSRLFWSRISQKRWVLGTVLLKTVIGNHLSNVATFNDLEWPLSLWPPISRSHFLKSNIVKSRLLKIKLLLHKKKLYLTYGMVLCLVTLTDY